TLRASPAADRIDAFDDRVPLNWLDAESLNSPACEPAMPAISPSPDAAPTTPHDRMRRIYDAQTAMPRGATSVDANQRHLTDAALGKHGSAAVPGRHHVAHDAAARRDGPGLKLLRARIEAHQGIRTHARLAVPDDAVERGDPVGLRGRTTRRRPLPPLAGRRGQPPHAP